MDRAEDTIRRICIRAAAYRRQWPTEARQLHEGRYIFGVGEEAKHIRVLDLCDLVEQGLKFLANLVKKVHRRPAELRAALRQAGHSAAKKAAELRDDLEAAVHLVAQDRTKHDQKEARRWAKMAPLRAAHKATKVKEGATRKSASALKTHLGENAPEGGRCGVR